MRIFLIALSFCLVASAQRMSLKGGKRVQIMEIAKSFEIRPMAKPSWAERQDKPLFRVAWFSDTHIGNRSQLPLLRAAFRYAEMKNADFAIFTGDNTSFSEGRFDTLQPPTVRKHAWFKSFLDTELKIPYKVIPGDNWYPGFIECFGSRNFAFDASGFHFIFTSLDTRAHSGEGCCKFDDATLAWIQNDLTQNAGKPTLFVLHETILPPSFLDAKKVERLLAGNKNVICTLSGHLHLDLDFTRSGFRQLVCPSLGRSHRPGFKLMSFYEDAIIIESCELNVPKNEFFMANKWQKVDVPETLKPVSSKLDLTNTAEMKPLQVSIDPRLSLRSKEIFNALMAFAMTLGTQGLF